MSYEDIVYDVQGSTAVVTINRPQRYNAFRGKTVEELIGALRTAWADRAVRVVVLTGAGNKAFCTGGDVKQRAETGDYGPTESGLRSERIWPARRSTTPSPTPANERRSASRSGRSRGWRSRWSNARHLLGRAFAP